MSRITILEPPVIAAHGILLLFFRHAFPVARYDFSEYVPLRALPQPRVGVVEDVSEEVYPTGINLKNLPVAFYGQLQLLFRVFPYVPEKGAEIFLVPQYDHVVRITEIMFHPFRLFHPVVEVRQVYIGQILAQIVPYRQPGRTVYHFVKDAQQTRVSYLLPDFCFHYVMVYGRIVFLDVPFQTVFRPLDVSQRPFYGLDPGMYPPALYAGVCAARERAHPYRLKDIHDGMMRNPVREIRKFEYLPFLGVMNQERPVR